MYPSVGFLLPLPGTHMYTYAKRHGLIRDDVEYLMSTGDRQDLHVNFTQMEDKEFLDTVREELMWLADKQGLKLDDPFKTTTVKVLKNKNKFQTS
tara:strand:- start:708 stop:992 length:285 start_codon:yes stop_codon:yes gene_type:complete